MPLFQENRVRSAVIATAAVGLGHFVTKVLVSPHSSQLLQSFVAVVAIAALVLLVILHHRQEGQVLSNTQEEAVLIGGLALLWIVIVVSWGALTGGGSSRGGGLRGSEGSYSRGGYAGWGEDPCPRGDPWCHVVEEYIW